MTDLIPSQIVTELDKYVIGQKEAKKAIAVSFRNRWRRTKVDKPMRNEILPKNILMIGSTGVGKTELARRIAKIVKAPFIKIEATKFTEVGYVGKDVESIVRELMEVAIVQVKQSMYQDLEQEVQEKVLNRILKAIVGENASDETKKLYMDKIISGEIKQQQIEIKVNDLPSNSAGIEIPGMGAAIGMINLQDMLSKSSKPKQKLVTLSVEEAMERIKNEELNDMIEQDHVINNAKKAVEENGIVFLDEIDKIVARGSESSTGKGEISREGVQRDLLPLIEGTVVNTKYGTIKTDHILFIAAGAFHMCEVTDLLPELQGRLPVRVQLKSLDKKDMIKILTETTFNLPSQYQALLEVEGIKLKFETKAIEKIADITQELNENVDNLGARRLHSVVEKVLEEISFDIEKYKDSEFIIDEKYIDQRIQIIKEEDANISSKEFIL